MTYSIPTDIASVDTDGDGKIDRLYVGDMGGQMWRFNIKDSNPSNWSGKIIFKSNPGKDGTTGRKIFYPPDVSLEKDYSSGAIGIMRCFTLGLGIENIQRETYCCQQTLCYKR